MTPPVAKQLIDACEESHVVKMGLDQFNVIFVRRILAVCKDDASALAS